LQVSNDLISGILEAFGIVMYGDLAKKTQNSLKNDTPILST